MAFQIPGYMLHDYAGDHPTRVQLEMMASTFIHEIQQTAQRLEGFFPSEPADLISNRQITRPIQLTYERENTFHDTVDSTTKLRTGIANATDEDPIQEVTGGQRFIETRKTYTTMKKRRWTAETFRTVPAINRRDMESNMNIFPAIQQSVMMEWYRHMDRTTLRGLEATQHEITETSSATAITATETEIPFRDDLTVGLTSALSSMERKVLDAILHKWETMNLYVDSLPEWGQPIFICTRAQVAQLFDDEKVINWLYSANRPLDSILLPNLNGFRIVTSNLLPKSNGIRTCYAVLPEFFRWYVHHSMFVKMDQLPNEYNNWQIHMEHDAVLAKQQDEGAIKVRVMESDDPFDVFNL